MSIRFALVGTQPSDVATAVLRASAAGTAPGELVLVVGREALALPDDTPEIAAVRFPPELDGDDVAVDGWLLEAMISHEIDLLVTLGPGQDVGATTASTLHDRILTLEAIPDGLDGTPSVLVSIRSWTSDHDRPTPVILQRTVPDGDTDDGTDGAGHSAELLLHTLGLLAAGRLDLDDLPDAG